MSNNEDILNNYEPASCFDKVKGGRGRPKLKLNATGIKVIEALSSVQCTHEEIAACLGTSKKTLYAKHNEEAFLTAYKKGIEQGKSARNYPSALFYCCRLIPYANTEIIVARPKSASSVC